MLNLLIVEDDERQIKLYKDTIDEFNTGSDIKIEVIISINLEEGLQQIRTKNFDAAIIDLRLGSGDIEGRGKEIIKEIKGNLRFPVFVLTAYPGDLGEDLKIPNAFYKVYEQTKKDTIEVLEEMTDIYKTGITKIMGRKGIVEKTLQEVFWENIAASMEYWKTEIEDESKIEKVLSRHILAHLSERLRLTEEGEFEKCHPAEVYIMPPIKKDFFTGDILKSKASEEYFLILTPACDMVLRERNEGGTEATYRNAEKIILAKLVDFTRIEEVAKYIETHSNTKKGEVEKYIRNTKKGRYHYLPSSGSRIPGFLVDFQDINRINPEKLTTYNRIASIDEPFLKDIIARFTSYYARQGSPDLDIDIILKKLING
ncbi:response regulator [candidate division WOR-3 bacterium]|nr:response regulator [candidate division WOR-3 bacterium]